ncbi:MAG: NAD-dependent epimerase [Hyphomicrobium sp.]|uniref:NAD-dependent epimerase n=1 Tax=Hyphomicrobium sp. TaxID=82 RepID=UPI0013289594|nr:NAD-dependent epimerase [Hyphomicrobium sp.]KAB2939931.1 MAG: NAD-dependent epimerase [Hyphomicrobium sp.]MBZ0209860.1 NAD-dependent epimerase [Hyphomicrobium sp.]
MRVLVTGAAGFIGYHTARALMARGDEVIGLDNLNPYYDVKLKEARLAELQGKGGFSFHKLDLGDRSGMERLFTAVRPQRVIHLGAQAGVRYGIEHPHTYVDANIVGTLHVLEGCRHHGVEHLVFASSSSVYGANTTMPFSVHQNVDHPLSIYAASKKANELMAHTYAHLYRLPVTGLRFFTVYGPWGRPDMALFLFTRKILAGEPIDVFNEGHHARDFTYIDDVVEGVLRTADRIPQPDPSWSGAHPDPATSSAPYRIYNIGNHHPVELMRFIGILEKALGREAKKNFLPLQPGDVPVTFADVDDLIADVGFAPSTPIEEGIPRFVAWYRSYYGS